MLFSNWKKLPQVSSFFYLKFRNSGHFLIIIFEKLDISIILRKKYWRLHFLSKLAKILVKPSQYKDKQIQAAFFIILRSILRYHRSSTLLSLQLRLWKISENLRILSIFTKIQYRKKVIKPLHLIFDPYFLYDS